MTTRSKFTETFISHKKKKTTSETLRQQFFKRFHYWYFINIFVNVPQSFIFRLRNLSLNVVFCGHFNVFTSFLKTFLERSGRILKQMLGLTKKEIIFFKCLWENLIENKRFRNVFKVMCFTLMFNHYKNKWKL